jgi:NAD(P)-dependent dehydrogenase (short-subunit alcohol dehydrogenase family)
MASSPQDIHPLAPGAALVAGGTGSLGQAICERLAETGAPVLVGYRHRREAAEAIADSIRSGGGAAEPVALDLTDERGAASALAAAERLAGGLGTLVYASGAQPGFDYLSRVESAEWRRVLEIELFGLLALAQAALPLLRHSRGAIVTIATYQARRLEARGGLSTIPKAAAERIIAKRRVMAFAPMLFARAGSKGAMARRCSPSGARNGRSSTKSRLDASAARARSPTPWHSSPRCGRALPPAPCSLSTAASRFRSRLAAEQQRRGLARRVGGGGAEPLHLRFRRLS